jgi:hypothetical protein
VQIGSPLAYRSLFLANAVTFGVAWVLMKRLPRYERLPRSSSGPRWEALGDKAFVAYAALSRGMFIQYFVLIFLLPVWIVDDTHAPRWSVSLIVLINTIRPLRGVLGTSWRKDEPDVLAGQAATERRRMSYAYHRK